MLESPINGWWAGRVMGYKHNPLELPFSDHSVQVSLLILSGVCIACWLIRGAPAKKIECDHPAMWGEVRNEEIVEMKVVRESRASK
jgi:hypothetical protein